MNTFAPPVRTHRAFADDETLQELLAERLRQAPWMVLSAALHAVLLLLVWILMPQDRPRPPHAVAALAPTEQLQPIETPPKPKPELKPEPVVDDVVVNDDPVVTDTPTDSPADSDSDAVVESAFDAMGTNTAVGLGPDAAGPYGNRGRPSGKSGGRQPQPNVQRGLAWLAAHQDDDGKWDADAFMKHDDPSQPICSGPGSPVHDVGVTGLALLAFLGENQTMRQGRYRDVVRRGVRWLRDQQQDNGLFGGNSSHDFIYDHAIATYAICEATGLSDSKLLRPTAQKAINYLESHRNPYSVWRYQPRDNDNDLSVTGWCIMAYESARYFGLEVNTGALKIAAAYLDQVSDASGRHGYTKAGEPSSRKPGEHAARFPTEKGEAMTAVGLFCRYFLGQDARETPVMAAATARLLQRPPVWDASGTGVDHYYWYYATYALFQAGGTSWRTWQGHIERAVGRTQHQDPADKNRFGSWDPDGAWGEDGGRVYSTAILTLTMQAHYRYSRLIH